MSKKEEHAKHKFAFYLHSQNNTINSQTQKHRKSRKFQMKYNSEIIAKE
jgi:hypothetical protein